jgi:hypothetical protein
MCLHYFYRYKFCNHIRSTYQPCTSVPTDADGNEAPETCSYRQNRPVIEKEGHCGDPTCEERYNNSEATRRVREERERDDLVPRRTSWERAREREGGRRSRKSKRDKKCIIL